MLKFSMEMSKKQSTTEGERRLCVAETVENKRGIRGFISQLIRGLMGCNGHCACPTGCTLNALNGLLG